MVNVPLSPGAGSTALRAAVTDQWLPELERLAPQMIFVSAGFDAHRDDPLASLTFTDEDFEWVETGAQITVGFDPDRAVVVAR